MIRSLYGSDAFYSEWSWRALSAWERWEGELGRQIFFKTGVLWMAREADGYEAAGEAVLRKLSIPVERLEPEALKARHPVIGTEGLRFAIFEPRAGALLARESVRRLAEAFVRRGGRLMRGAAELGATTTGGRLAEVRIGSETIAARALRLRVRPLAPAALPRPASRNDQRVHRAEELYFGLPKGEAGFDAANLPAWLEIGAYYGIPALDGRAFKIGIDTPGPEIDPTSAERRLDPASVAIRARVSAPTLPRSRGRAGRRLTRLHLRADRGRTPADRPASRDGKPLARRRRLRPRLQARARSSAKKSPIWSAVRARRASRASACPRARPAPGARRRPRCAGSSPASVYDALRRDARTAAGTSIATKRSAENR